MKEFEPIAQEKDKELAVHQNKTQHKLIGQMQAIKGLTLFECSPEGEVAPAQYEEVYDLASKERVKKVITKPNYQYVQALNKKNAERKLGIH